MTRTDCNLLTEDINKVYDIVIIGSGPAGSSCAAKLAEAGLSVAIVEEGDWHNAQSPAQSPVQSSAQRNDHKKSHKNLGASFASLYRDGGSNAIMGTPPIPFLQGRAGLPKVC